jgi:hypothetical protein
MATVTGEIVERMTRGETAELRRQEKRIDAALPAFTEIGDALATIRDNRLYRGTHATFDAYLAERWSFTRQRASQLITAAQTTAALPAAVRPAIDSERKARAIRPVADKPAKARAALRAAERAADGEPTAADIERAVDTISDGGRGVPAAAPPSETVTTWVTEALPLTAMSVEERRRIRRVAAGLVATVDRLNGDAQRDRQRAAAQRRAPGARSTTVTPRFKK